MAIRYAVANGNWSDTATWDGGTLPAVDDDVFANNFTVTIDGTFTVLTIRNTANTTPAITAGGFFTFANGGNLTCTTSGNSVVNRPTSGVYCLIFNLPSGQSATFNGSVNQVPFVNGGRVILIENTGTFNMVGNYSNISNTQQPRYTVFVNGSTTVNIIGDINNLQTTLHTNCTFFINAGNPIINITGNLSGGISNSITSQVGQAIFCVTSTTLNITGDITTNSSPTIWFNTTGTLNLVGNATGGTSHPAVYNVGTGATVDIIGTTTSGSGYPAIQGLLTTFVIVRGNVINTDTYYAIYAGRITIDDNVTSWQYKDSTNSITRTIYTAGVDLGNPLESDVRDGLDYGPSLELTGTMTVPPTGSVRKDVPVDNTLGTAELTASDLLNGIATSSDPIAIRLRNVSTVETTGAQIAGFN
jgi:hypothetical protein